MVTGMTTCVMVMIVTRVHCYNNVLSLGVLELDEVVLNLIVTVDLIGVCGLCGAASVQGGKSLLGMKSTLLSYCSHMLGSHRC